MKVGDKVKINIHATPDYFEPESNPVDTIGVITEIDDQGQNSTCLNVMVTFEDGTDNAYLKNHLIVQD